MRLKLVISFLLICFTFNAFCQAEIDYLPKLLTKELTKYAKGEPFELQELPHNDETYYNGKFFKIMTTIKDFPLSYIYIGRVNSCRAGGCSINNTHSNDGPSEYFDYFMLFDKKLWVKFVKVYNYQATHGEEVTAAGWLRQFIGYDGSSSLKVGKEIDAISGATISANGITADIEYKSKLIKKLGTVKN